MVKYLYPVPFYRSFCILSLLNRFQKHSPLQRPKLCDCVITLIPRNCMTRRAISCPTSMAIKSRRPSCWKSLDPSFLRLQFLQSRRNGFGVHVSVSPSEPGLLSFIRLYCYIYELYYEMNRALPSSISLSCHRRIRQRHPLRNYHSLSSHFFSFSTQINP